MFEGIKVNGNWRKWCNNEMMQPFGKLDVFSFITISVWIGLVMLTERIVKEKQVKYLIIIHNEIV